MNIHRFKKTTQALLVCAVSVVSVSPADADDSLPIVDGSTHTLFYKLGGGRAVPIPGSGYVTHRVTARFKAGLGYSCGKFDFHNNVSEMINQIQTKARQIPIQLQAALSAAVAGLPGYLMQKINPNLYNIVTKSLDETADLFNLSYKTCETMEAEMRANPGSNPYAGFMSVSIGSKWKAAASSGENIADTKADIATDPSAPVKWIGGHDYGTEDRPIQINHDLVIAGYNIMLGRSGDVSVNTIPTGALALQPIAKIWNRPSAAGEWLQEVVGDKLVVTAEKTPPEAESITGDGLRPIVADLEPQIRDALDEAVRIYDFTEINQFNSLGISNGLIDGLRAMPLGERLVFLDRLANEMAVNEAYERVMLIRQMLMIGLNAPDIVASQASGTTTEYVRTATLPDLDTLVGEIYNDLALKRSTVNATALSIINQNNARNTSGIATTPGNVEEEPAMLDGAIKE